MPTHAPDNHHSTVILKTVLVVETAVVFLVAFVHLLISLHDSYWRTIPAPQPPQHPSPSHLDIDSAWMSELSDDIEFLKTFSSDQRLPLADSTRLTQTIPDRFQM